VTNMFWFHYASEHHNAKMLLEVIENFENWAIYNQHLQQPRKEAFTEWLYLETFENSIQREKYGIICE